MIFVSPPALILILSLPFLCALLAAGLLISAGLGYRGSVFRGLLVVVVGLVAEIGVFFVAESFTSRLPAGESGEWAPLGAFILAILATLVAGFPVFFVAHRLVFAVLAAVPPRGERSNVLLGLGALVPVAALWWAMGPGIWNRVDGARRDALQFLRDATPPRPEVVRPRPGATSRTHEIVPARRETVPRSADVTGRAPRPRPTLPPAARSASLAAQALSRRADTMSAPEVAALMHRTEAIEDQATLCQSLADRRAYEYGPEVVAWLRRLLEQDRACAACFKCALGFGVVGTQDILVESGARGTPHNRREALVTLGGFVFAPFWNAPRVESLYDPNPEIRRAACESLVAAQHQVRDRALPAAVAPPGDCGVLQAANWRASAESLRAMAEGPPTVGSRPASGARPSRSSPSPAP